MRRHPESSMPKSIVMATAATADLDPAPIPTSWILEGTPEATRKQFVRTDDRNSYIVAWDCTPGRFTWHYNEDETLVVLSGEAFITTEEGEERRLAPGDMAFFPAGTSAIWRVLKTCYTGLNLYDAMRRFRGDDVVTLDGVRCSGAAHDGCQKACLIFWREAWLRKVEPAAVQPRVEPEARQRLRACLKTSTGPQTYFCQASELLNATLDVPRREQLRTCVSSATPCVWKGPCADVTT